MAIHYMCTYQHVRICLQVRLIAYTVESSIYLVDILCTESHRRNNIPSKLKLQPKLKFNTRIALTGYFQKGLPLKRNNNTYIVTYT